MFHPRFSSFIVFCVGLLGFALGLWVRSPQPDVANDAKLVSPSEAVAKIDTEAILLDAASVLITDVVATQNPAQTNPDSVSVSYELLKQLVTNPEDLNTFYLFGKDRRLEEILEINEIEKVAIQNLWREHKARIKELQVDVAEYEEQEDGSLFFYVPDLNSVYEREQTGLHREMVAVLGEDRAKIFNTIKQTDNRLKLNKGETRYLLSMEEIGDGQWRYRTEVEDDDGKRVWVGSAIPHRIRHLTDAVGIEPKLADTEMDDE